MTTERTAIVPTSEKVQLLKAAFSAENLTDDELRVFLWQAERLGLDPLAGQVFPVKRSLKGGKTKVQVQASVDGLRARAHRTGECAGIDDAVFVEDISDDGQRVPRQATVTVYRLTAGTRYAYTATARWTEYYPNDARAQFMWNRMGFTMLAKCAEGLALRKAFPAELSGAYLSEEMDQAKGEAEGAAEVEQETGGAEVEAAETKPEPKVLPMMGLYGAFKKQPIADIETKHLVKMLSFARDILAAEEDLGRRGRVERWIAEAEVVLDQRREDVEDVDKGGEKPVEPAGQPE